jgi:flagellar basal-body rod protein FlgC
MDLTKSMKIAASGLQAQSTRLRTVAENLANADSLAKTPDGQPYRRKMVTFRSELDRSLGTPVVKVAGIGYDKTAFEKRLDPQHPAADADGYVLTPNVNPLIELMDMRQAQRSYDANLSVIEVSKSMLSRTIDILRG